MLVSNMLRKPYETEVGDHSTCLLKHPAIAATKPSNKEATTENSNDTSTSTTFEFGSINTDGVHCSKHLNRLISHKLKSEASAKKYEKEKKEAKKKQIR